MPNIIPIGNLKDTSAVSQACRESSEPIYLTQNGYGNMVALDAQAYEEEMIQLEIDRKIEEALEDVRQGRLVDAFEAHAEIRKKYGL